MQSYKHIVRDENKIRGMFPLVVLLAFFDSYAACLPFVMQNIPTKSSKYPRKTYISTVYIKEIISKPR